MNRIKFPFKIIEEDEQPIESQNKNRNGNASSSTIFVGPKKYCLHKKYKEAAEDLYNFEVRKDDIWIVTFPRSGTTWTQEMVWLLANNLDYEKAANIPLTTRSPFLEFSTVADNELNSILKTRDLSENERKSIEEWATPGWELLTKYEDRRIIKTHLALSLLPPNLLTSGCKVVYVARNPKDCIVSNFHFNRNFREGSFTGSFAKFYERFSNNLHIRTPFFEHIKEAWVQRTNKNLLFLFYDDMAKDLGTSIKKTAEFLDVDISEQEIEVLKNHLDIKNFRKNASVNSNDMVNMKFLFNKKDVFVNKGKSGSWKEMFDEELNRQADKWIEENLKDTDLRFPL